MLKIHKITARDLPDLWFQAVSDILDNGRRYTIDEGSYAGATRLEFDYFMGHVLHPGTRPFLPDMPPHCNIPAPVEEAYVYGGKGYTRSYVEYIMTPTKQEGESYTYGERLTRSLLLDWKWLAWNDKNKDIMNIKRKDGKIVIEDNYSIYINQIEWIIDTYKTKGYNNNQMILQVGEPTDCTLLDPPCLRQIDTRIMDDKLHFFVYFRSWDLWNGLAANLAGIQELKEYMAGEIGVGDGEMIVESKGLHLYGYAEELAEMRTLKECHLRRDLNDGN